MLDEETNTVSLIDYGQLLQVEKEYRTNFAKFIIAVDDRNKEEVHRLWNLLGNEFIWRPTGEINPINETFGCSLFHYGGTAGMVEGMKILEYDSFADVMDDFYKEASAKKINITKTHPLYGMYQRGCFCLSGVAAQLGQGQISSAAMLRKGALKYLEKIEKEK